MFWWNISLPRYSTTHCTPSTNQKNTKSIQSTPKILKNMWAKAARRACVLAERAARLEVIVVPMFSPSTRAIPIEIGMAPLPQSNMVMAITAADDCTQKVSTPPRSRNAKTVR